MSNARTVALETLIKVFNQKSYSNIALNNELIKHDLKPADKALATRIVYGTIQYKIFLEYQLKPLIKTKLRDSFLKPSFNVCLPVLFLRESTSKRDF